MFFAVAMGSCSKDQPNTSSAAAQSGDNLVAINVYAGTSRASDTTTATLTDDGEVILHINDSDGLSETLTFYYLDGEWSQDGDEDDAIKWEDIVFPANFYSFHDGDAMKTLTFDSTEAVYSSYTVTGASTEHKDLVTHASILNTMPMGGAVSVYHKHALSKIHLLASTGDNTVYVAYAEMVTIDGEGDVTITPLTAEELATESGISWENSKSVFEDYGYLAIGENDDPVELKTTDGSNPLINKTTNAPLMIIPQTTTAAEVTGSVDDVATFDNSYVKVIYYMVDSEGMPVVGFSSVGARPDASDYVDADQKKALYVMAAFPLSYTFVANKEYNVNLGLGVDGSTGGILVADYYVDYKGDPVTLTKVDSETGTPEEEDVPGIDEGDYILGDSGDAVSIIVTATGWTDAEDEVYVEHTVEEETTE